jgi:membrane protease YdiL (CAAX protease family)
MAPAGLSGPAGTGAPDGAAPVRAHRLPPLVAFFGLAFAGTWLAAAPVVLGPSGFGLLPALPDVLSLLIYFGATFAGPTVAAFAAAKIEGGSAGVRRFAAGYGRWRVAPGWWLTAPLLFPALWLAGYSVVLEGAPLLNLARDPRVLLTVFLPALALLSVVGLGEEAGWRGFALPRMQETLGPVRATLVLGLLHGLWHLPVLASGILGPFTASSFVTFVVVAVLGTFVYTWVANRTRYSILIATLVHAGSNAATNLMTRLVELPYVGDPRVAWLLEENRLNVLIFGAAALALLAATRGRLGYRGDQGSGSPA